MEYLLPQWTRGEWWDRSVLLDRNVPVRDGELWQWRFHGKHTVPGQRRLNGLRICSLGQQKLPVVFSVHRFRIRFLLVFGVDLKSSHKSVFKIPVWSRWLCFLTPIKTRAPVHKTNLYCWQVACAVNVMRANFYVVYINKDWFQKCNVFYAKHKLF